MMRDVLRRLGYDELLRQERPRLGEDYVFDSRVIAAAKELRVDHENVFLEETPLSLVRQIHLQHGSKPHTSLQLMLALCWNGFREALTLLSRFAESFERRIPEENVVNTAQAHQIGEFGVAWAWSEKGGPDILGFVRKNILVGVRGHDAGELIIPLAKEVDAALSSSKPTEQYGDTPHPLFTELRKREGEIPQVPATGKLSLGTPLSGEITLFWVDAGILPKRDRLSVDVT